MKIFLFSMILILIPVFSLAWDGYDYEKGNYIEIEEGNLVRSGNDIEIYDYESGTYRDVEVQSIGSSGSSTEVEVYDYDNGENRTFDMDER